MAGTISMAGLASGMDVAGIMDALVNARAIQQTAAKSRITSTKSAATAISDIGGLLGKLKTAVDAISDPDGAQGLSTTSSNAAVTASPAGTASTGRYAVTVASLAQSYRAYSSSQSSATGALGQEGTMNIAVGTAANASIAITPVDSLTSIADKINNAELGVHASTFYDGSQYRLQLNGTNTGADNDVTITNLDLGLNANVKQHAQDAHAIIDNYHVYSRSNQIVGAIPGVTLGLSDVTPTAAIVETKSNPDTLKTKLQAVVDAYNAVVNKVHSTSGYGSLKASVEALSGDSTLRSLTSGMSRAIMNQVDTGSSYSTLASIGVSLTRDGTLSLDSSKFGQAVGANPDAVTKILAGTSSGDGIMDTVSDFVDSYNRSGTGILATKATALSANVQRLQARVDEQQERLDAYRAQLEKQFAAMDAVLTSTSSVTSYLDALDAASKKDT